MAWIESHQELRNHPKTKRLARELKVSVAAAIGHLHCLWWWAADYAPDGDLTDYDDWEIADAALYDGEDSGKFRDALISVGFLDNTEYGRIVLHDWDDYAGKNLKQRKKARERTQRYRDRKSETSQDGNVTEEPDTDNRETDITEPECDSDETHTVRIRNANSTSNVQIPCASTGHNITGHNITDITVQDNTDPPYSPPGAGGKDPPTDLQERRFDEFWAAYPRKVGKGAARKAWKKIHPNAELHKAIMESVRANTESNPQWRRDNGQYIPHPTTWLNQQRWEDEKPKATQTHGGEHNDGGIDSNSTGFQRSTGFRRADPEADSDG